MESIRTVLKKGERITSLKNTGFGICETFFLPYIFWPLFFSEGFQHLSRGQYLLDCNILPFKPLEQGYLICVLFYSFICLFPPTIAFFPLLIVFFIPFFSFFITFFHHFYCFFPHFYHFYHSPPPCIAISPLFIAFPPFY